MTRPYRPSNGTEGEIFCNKFCHRCIRDVGEACDILTRTLIHDIDDAEYPTEWVEGPEPYPNDNPRCTAFATEIAEIGRIEDPRQIELPI